MIFKNDVVKNEKPFYKKPMCETNIYLHDLIDICRSRISREATFAIYKYRNDMNDEFIEYMTRQNRIIDKLSRYRLGNKLSYESIHTYAFRTDRLLTTKVFNNRFYVKRIRKIKEIN